MESICPQCQRTFEAKTGAFNRAKKLGAPLYCGRTCAGLARRLKNPPTEMERKAVKAEYDREYRQKNRERLKQEKAAQFQRWYARPENQEKARAYRQERMPRHIEYCRRPEYRAKKREYDLERRLAQYGEFADVYVLLRDVVEEIKSRAGKAVNLEKAKEKTNERGHLGNENADGR